MTSGSHRSSKATVKPSEHFLSSGTLSLPAPNMPVTTCPANAGPEGSQKVLSSAASSLRFGTNPRKIKKQMTISTIYIAVCYAHAVSPCLLLRKAVCHQDSLNTTEMPSSKAELTCAGGGSSVLK